MAKTKTESIADIQTRITELKRRQKELVQARQIQERKDRTRRLCKRAGLLESLLPDTIPLTDEQFKAFLEKTVATDNGRETLAAIAAQNAATAAPDAPETAAQGNAPPALKPAETAQSAAQ